MSLDSSKISVRPMKDTDRDAVVEIDKAVAGRERSDYIASKLAWATAENRGVPLASLVAEYEGRVVGFVMGEIYLGEFGSPGDKAALDTVGVHPDFQHQGVGHRLFEEFLRVAKEAGVKRLLTLVEWNDKQLIHFFNSVGFSPAGTLNLQLEIEK